jgi:hypothetical protein
MRRMEKMEYFSRVENLSLLAQKISDTLDRNPGLSRGARDLNGINETRLGLKLQESETIDSEDFISQTSPQKVPSYIDSDKSPKFIIELNTFEDPQKIALGSKPSPKDPRSEKILPKMPIGGSKPPTPDLKSPYRRTSESKCIGRMPPQHRDSKKKSFGSQDNGLFKSEATFDKDRCGTNPGFADGTAGSRLKRLNTLDISDESRIETRNLANRRSNLGISSIMGALIIETDESKSDDETGPYNRNQPNRPENHSNRPKDLGYIGIGQDYMDLEGIDALDNNSQNDYTPSRNTSSLQTSVATRRLKGFFLEQDIIL